MNRSVTVRNLAGGFLGGTTGIFISWYLSPIALPFGVLLGVLVGWRYEEIVQLFSESYREVKKPKVVKAIAVVLQSVIAMVTVVPALPLRFYRWLASHPMNRACVIKTGAILLFYSGVFTLMLLAELSLGITGESEGLLVVLGLMVTAFGFLAYIAHYVLVNEQGLGLKELGSFYCEWEVIDRYGLIGFFFYVFVKHAWHVIGSLVFIAIAIPWTIAAVIVAGVISFLFAFIIHFMWEFYQLASRSGHWLCLGVTMVTTGISWFIYHESFADPRILWMVALVTGIISSGMTEIVHQAMSMFYMNTATGRKLVTHLSAQKEIFDPTWNMFESFCCVWFEQSRLARMFRAVCFDTTVTQPARVNLTWIVS